MYQVVVVVQSPSRVQLFALRHEETPGQKAGNVLFPDQSGN